MKNGHKIERFAENGSEMRTYSLITGASRGIGHKFAMECAKRGKNLLLVSLHDEQLPTLASRLAQEYDIDVKYHETDLTEPEAVRSLYNWCEQNGLEIDMLINNAGLGSQGIFSKEYSRYYLKLMQINMEVMVLMTAQFLPMLKRQEKAYILNMGSIASFMHIPYKQVYAASKNFVMAYSNAMNYELKPHNIQVTCICPGPTVTNAKVAARVKEQGWKSQLVTLSAATVARKGINGLMKGKRIIIPGWGNKTLAFISWILPTWWSMILSGNMFNKSGEVAETLEKEAVENEVM